MDLQAWIEHLIGHNNDIILCLDANEAIYGLSGVFNPLEYTTEKPTQGNNHDGSLAALIRTCGLIDPLLIQHSDHPPFQPICAGKIESIIYLYLMPCSLLSRGQVSYHMTPFL
jgi:hypothetical protein